MKTMLPDWLPKWDDDSAYPANVDAWSLFQWVWAFIRRNTEYQADYARFSALLSYDSVTHSKTSKWAGQSPCIEDDMSLRYCDPPSLPGETYGQYRERLAEKIEVELPLEEHLMEKWGISNLPAPSDNDGYKIISPADEGFPETIQLDGECMPRPDKYEQVTLRFDLRFGIDTQINRAKEILNDERARINSLFSLKKKRATTLKKTELLKYLRAFDAKNANADFMKTGAKLYPEKKNSKDSMKQSAYRASKQGQQLVEGGYKDLLKFW